MSKDINKVPYEELADTLLEKMEELKIEREKNLALQMKFNNALSAILTIKQMYPHVLKECVSQERIDKICKSMG